MGRLLQLEAEQDLSPRSGRVVDCDEHPVLAQVQARAMPGLPRLGELDVELDRNPGMGLWCSVMHPLAYQVRVNEKVEAHAMGDAGPQTDWRWFVKPDDKSAQWFFFTHLDHYRGPERDGLGQ
jgi:hypothetical protein